MIRIALLGFGTVGRGVYQILNERRQEISQQLGQYFEVVHVLVRHPEKYSEIEGLVTKDLQIILNDPSIDLVIEVTGEVEGMIGAIKTFLSRKIPVVSANKALISKYFKELHELAHQNACPLRYEAAVGAALPILNQIPRIKTLNEVEQVYGVINGSTNFILCQMAEGKIYEEAIDIAQDLGYLEADPTADVSGRDARSKIRILAGLLYDYEVVEDEIEVQGITEISLADIQAAQAQGEVIKLIARANRSGQISVQPERLPVSSILGGLKGGENAVIFETSNAQEIVIMGQGAGSRETAFAVLSDLIDIFETTVS